MSNEVYVLMFCDRIVGT